MKAKQRKRTLEEIEFDQNFAIDFYLQGYPVRTIATMLINEHTINGNPYNISHMQVYKDVFSVIEKAKKMRDESGINHLEDLIVKYEHLYNEANIAMRAGDPTGRKDAKNILDSLQKLLGLGVEKSEVLIKYDVTLE
jgi:hypothetical protein